MKKYLLTLIIIFLIIPRPASFNKQTVPDHLKGFESSILFRIHQRINEIIPYRTILMREVRRNSFSYGYGLTIEKLQPIMIINVKF